MTEAENKQEDGVDSVPSEERSDEQTPTDEQVLTEEETLTEEQGVVQEQEAEEALEPLALEVQIERLGACQRHIVVTVSHEDVQRYLDREFEQLVPTASVPGFRPGRAPRQLVERRFKDSIREQVKSKLLVDALGQASESYDLSPISEPEIDMSAIDVPDEGPLVFEFDLEVRPEFSVPQWKGLALNQPKVEVDDATVEEELGQLLKRWGRLVPRHGPAEAGDRLTLDMEFAWEDRVISRSERVHVELKPKLSLQDAEIPNFGELMAGAGKGDVRETEVEISSAASNPRLAGQTVRARFEVQAVDRVEPPKLTPSFLDEVGGFETEDELREAIKQELIRQYTYRANRYTRQQITTALTTTAYWDLPPTMLRRQAQRELRRAEMELRSAGLNEDKIQTALNQLKQNVLDYTSRALKEHFILERIAEEEKIEAEDDDFAKEIQLIAQNEGVPERRVRARIEKRGEMDALRNQIVERKVIELIVSEAVVTEVPFEPQADDTIAISAAIAGVDRGEIPEAKHGEEAAAPPQ